MIEFDQGQVPIVVYVNLAKTPLGIDFDRMVQVHQKFLDTMFAPVWGCTAHLCISNLPPPNKWLMLFVDNADEDDSLGYHDLTKNGYPVCKIFVKETLKQGEPISVNASHELCEMLVDPGNQMWALNDEDGRLYSYETSDAVEGKTFELDGVPLANFVYPSFFESFRKSHSCRFDHLGLVTRPFETLPDGYQLVMKEGRAHEIYGSHDKAYKFLAEDRRGHRTQQRKESINAVY